MINLIEPVKLLELYLERITELYINGEVTDLTASKADVVALIYYYRMYGGKLEDFLLDCKDYDLDDERHECIRSTWANIARLTPIGMANLAIENLHFSE